MPRNDMPWFPFYVRDFLTSETVRLLSNEMVGIYVKLLCHQWLEGSIPNDGPTLEKLVGWEQDFDPTESDAQFPLTVVQRLFNGRSTSVGRMFNDRLETVRVEQSEKASKRAESARNAGLASAKARIGQEIPHSNGRSTVVQRPSTIQSQKQIQTQIQKDQQQPPPSALPLWLPAEAWNHFLEHRKAKRAKPTTRAIELMIRDLDTWRQQGQDPTAVLEQAIKKGWTGLRPLESQHEANGNGQKPTRQEQHGEYFKNRARELEDAIRRSEPADDPSSDIPF